MHCVSANLGAGNILEQPWAPRMRLAVFNISGRVQWSQRVRKWYKVSGDSTHRLGQYFPDFQDLDLVCFVRVFFFPFLNRVYIYFKIKLLVLHLFCLKMSENQVNNFSAILPVKLAKALPGLSEKKDLDGKCSHKVTICTPLGCLGIPAPV